MPKLNPFELKELIEELVSLLRQQDEARQTEVFLHRTEKEVDAINQRISEIYAILNEESTQC